MSPRVRARAWSCVLVASSASPVVLAQSLPPSGTAAVAPARASPGAHASPPSSVPLPERAASPEAAQAGLRWLPWTFLALGGAATAGALIAFSERERHATRWNSAACIRPGVSRGSVCGGERDAIENWDRALVVSGVSAALFFGGAVLSRSLEPDPSRAPETAVWDCALGWGELACRGRF